jgi:putative ABC transport system permease protein
MSDDPTRSFWLYAMVGAPAMFAGYFLLGVPLVWFIARGFGPTIGRLLGLPRSLLGNNVSSTPMRSGFTAGALMVGLATMTTVYANGNGVMRDWVDSIRFPDAFVNGLMIGLTPEARATIDALDIVEHTCAVSVFKAETGRRGLFETGLNRPKAYFIAFEPEPFFAMTDLYWGRGEEAYAKRRLDEGGAVIASLGYMRAHPEMKIGDTVVIEHRGAQIGFELVGAVSSPGLDLVRKHFEFEEDFAEFANTSIFGTRDDLKRIFGSEAISLIQIGLREGVDDQAAVQAIEAALDQPGYVVGSGRAIKESVNSFGRSIMTVANVIAIGAMLIGCAGVASVVVAGVDARRFEFGVLRSIGAGRGLLARLVVGEVLLIALGACVLGTALGLQQSWASMRVYSRVSALSVRPRVPVGLVASGWLILIVLVLGSVAPVVWSLMRTRTRELLFSTRG